MEVYKADFMNGSRQDFINEFVSLMKCSCCLQPPRNFIFSKEKSYKWKQKIAQDLKIISNYENKGTASRRVVFNIENDKYDDLNSTCKREFGLNFLEYCISIRDVLDIEVADIENFKKITVKRNYPRKRIWKYDRDKYERYKGKTVVV